MVIRFGDFELDDDRLELRRSGQVVPVQRRVFETIFYLAARAGRVVTREELVTGPWRGMDVGDAAIARAVKEARAALGDRATAPSTIVTVRGVGFRFEAEVNTAAGASAVDESQANGRAFAGRERELAELERAWHEAQSGRGNLVFVAGSPGIGKSTLVERFFQRVRERGGEVHVGRCFEAQGTPPHWPWPELLGSYVERHGSSRVKELAPGDLAELVSIAPALAKRIDAASSGLAEGPYSAFRALDAVARFWRRASERGPLALVLEDLHLAEGAALDLLEHLLRSISSSMLLVVATGRAVEARQRKQLRALLEGAVLHTRTLELAGLTKRDVSRWFHSAGAVDDANELTERVTRATDGHPLLIANLLRALPPEFDAADLDQALARGLFIPDNLSASIRAELERLESEALAFVRTASVLGEEPWLPVIAELMQCASGKLGPALDRALRAGILERHDSGRLRFTHALVRDHLYGSLEPSRRLELHAAAAAALSARLQDHPELIVEAAHHAVAASPGANVEGTIALLVKAATWARRRLAFGLAAEHLRWALQTLDLGGPAPRLRAELLLQFAQSLHLAGRAEDAVRAYHELYELGEANDFDDVLAAGIFGDYDIRLEAVLVDPRFHARLAGAVSRPRPRDAVYARLKAIQAAVTPFSESEQVRMGWFQEACDIVPADGEPQARLAILRAGSRLDILNKYAEPERLLPLSDELVSLARSLGAADTLVHATVWRAVFVLAMGRGAEFLDEVRSLQEVAHRLRQPQWHYFPRLLQSSAASLAGDLTNSERLAREAADIGRTSVGILTHSLLAVQLLALAQEADGEKRGSLLKDALAEGHVVNRHVPNFEVMSIMVAMLETNLGDSQAGDRILRSWQEQWVARTFRSDTHTLFKLSLLTNVAMLLGDREVAALLHEALVPHARVHIVGSFGVAYCGPVDFWLGRLGALIGRSDVTSRFEKAVEAAKSARSQSFKAWAELGLAEALSKSGRPEDIERSRVLRESARRTATEFDLPRLLGVTEGRVAF
jgi:DNA-binding winged helix-turn-helix (wHTH) protein